MKPTRHTHTLYVYYILTSSSKLSSRFFNEAIRSLIDVKSCISQAYEPKCLSKIDTTLKLSKTLLFSWLTNFNLQVKRFTGISLNMLLPHVVIFFPNWNKIKFSKVFFFWIEKKTITLHPHRNSLKMFPMWQTHTHHIRYFIALYVILYN